jgi:hypothetical protein
MRADNVHTNARAMMGIQFMNIHEHLKIHTHNPVFVFETVAAKRRAHTFRSTSQMMLTAYVHSDTSKSTKINLKMIVS